MLGWVYLYPHEEAGVDVRTWVRRDAWQEGLDPILEHEVREWIARDWPFDRAFFRDRDPEISA